MSKQGTLISVADSQEGATPRLVTETEPFPIALFDGFGSPIESLKGAINIHDADVHNSIIDKYVHQHTATVTTLAADSLADDYQLQLTSAAGFAVNDFIHINTTTVEATHPKITAIVGNLITLDRRLDRSHIAGDDITKVIIDMADNTLVGTMVAPQIFWAAPEDGDVWHITRLLFSMVHGTAGDLGLFGNLAALINGVVIRVRLDGVYYTFTNWKQNADIKSDMFDVVFDPRSGGQGNYGTSGRGTFAAAGSVIRLSKATNDRFEVYIQDDITALGLFNMKLQGHFEDS